MKLDRVTITGADDSVSPFDLACLSRDFPFVEWAILFSPKHIGQPRWPSSGWLAFLRKEAFNMPMNLSAHLCGGWVRDLLAGDFTFATWFAELFDDYDRVQLNFHAEPQQVLGAKFLEALKSQSDTFPVGRRQFIFQIDGVNDSLFEHALAEGNELDVVPLFDLSHGAGVLPNQWPTADKWLIPVADGGEMPGYHGYAGGLGPDNVAEQLPLIDKAAAGGAFWIDMETRVRSENDRVFDLDKVRRVLEACAPFVTKTATV